MSLRRQLLLVSLLLLTLPWAGCQFIREMEGALRQGQEQAVAATARAIASSLSGRTALLYPQPGRLGSPRDERVHLYARAQQEPVILDGYGDGWEGEPHYVFTGDPEATPLVVTYQAVSRGETLYLLLKVQDRRVRYQDPGIGREPNGDRLVLRTWLEGRRQEYVIAPLAPGQVFASYGGRIQRGTDPRRIRGYWQDTRDGYSIELELPIRMTGGRLGFYVVNVNEGRKGNVSTLGNITPLETTAPPWLIYSPPELQRAMQGFARLGQQLEVADMDGWEVADIRGKASNEGYASSETFWLLRALYRRVLSREQWPPRPMPDQVGQIPNVELIDVLTGQESVRWYRDPRRAGYNQLAAIAPISSGDKDLGAVIVHSSSAEYLSLADQAFGKLLGYSLGAMALTVLGLLGYASLLSFRIHRLSRAASEAIGEDGAVQGRFPRSRAGDEIGELSRQYGGLLDRVRAYNDYLRGLSRKLSHELRTPIAVIGSSLDNLEHQGGADSQYVNRARDGLHRLNSILSAMSEASELEASIRSNPKQATDLAQLLDELGRAYRGLYTGHRIEIALADSPALASASPELLAQALDKLMENAASFCPKGGEIRLGLASEDGRWLISVENEGPALPLGSLDKLFEPMVSMRDDGGKTLHMGLGLHVARLIADYHNGQLSARNLPDGAGAAFTLSLPQTEGAPEGAPE